MTTAIFMHHFNQGISLSFSVRFFVGKKVLALLGYIFDILQDIKEGLVASKKQVDGNTVFVFTV